jgi:hypothetical protein
VCVCSTLPACACPPPVRPHSSPKPSHCNDASFTAQAKRTKKVGGDETAALVLCAPLGFRVMQRRRQRRRAAWQQEEGQQSCCAQAAYVITWLWHRQRASVAAGPRGAGSPPRSRPPRRRPRSSCQTLLNAPLTPAATDNTKRRSASSASTGPATARPCASRSRRWRSASTPSTSATSAARWAGFQAAVPAAAAAFGCSGRRGHQKPSSRRRGAERCRGSGGGGQRCGVAIPVAVCSDQRSKAAAAAAAVMAVPVTAAGFLPISGSSSG